VAPRYFLFFFSFFLDLIKKDIQWKQQRKKKLLIYHILLKKYPMETPKNFFFFLSDFKVDMWFVKTFVVFLDENK
jgi:hypothetical protein